MASTSHSPEASLLPDVMPFRDDDRDKDVVTPDGTRVGSIHRVEDEKRARVRRHEDDESLTDKVKEMLGWDDNHDEHELSDEHVDRRDDDRVYLRQY